MCLSYGVIPMAARQHGPHWGGRSELKKKKGRGAGRTPAHLVHSHLLQTGEWDQCPERVKDVPEGTQPDSGRTQARTCFLKFFLLNSC